MQNSIRKRLTMTFIGLAVGPLLLIGLLLAWQSLSVQYRQALALQHETVQRVSVEVTAFIQNLENALILVGQVQGLKNLNRDHQKDILSELLTHECSFAELILLEGQGKEIIHLSRLEVFTEADLGQRPEADEFMRPKASGKPYYSPVWVDEMTREPLMAIAVPLPDLRSGLVSDVLVANIRFKPVWDLIAGLRIREGESVYIVDAQGKVIAHRNPSVVLRNSHFNPPDQDGIQTGLTGTGVVMAVNRIRLNEQEFIIVAERSVSSAFALAIKMVFILVILMVIALSIAVGLGVLLVHQIVRPIEVLATAARAIRAGDLSQQVKVSSQDEIGSLAEIFNSMIVRLQQTLKGLEQRVVELRQAQEALQQALAWQEAIFEGSRDAIFISDTESCFVTVNHAACELTGYAREELLTMRISDLYEETDLGTYRQFHDPIMASQEITSEAKILRKDGSSVDIEFSNHRVIIANTLYMHTTARDITERKQADEALRLNESRLNSLFELSQKTHLLSEKEIVQFGLEEAVRLTESKLGYFHFVNRDQETIELYTWSHDTLQECTATPENHYPISQAGVWADCARIGKPVIHNDYPHLPYKRGLPEGHAHLIRHMSVPVLDEGKVQVITGVANKKSNYNDADMRQLQLLANDVWKIIQHKRAEVEREALIAELETKNAELDRFTYTVSHDLKSPLVTIRGFLGFLEQDVMKGDMERLQSDIQHILGATDTMHQLLNELLELSRIGRLMNSPQVVPFGELAQEAIERVTGQIAKRGVHVTIAPDLPIVFGDRSRLIEVVQNLLENAVKFIGDQPDPIVEIGAIARNGELVFYVTDNGIGIEPRYHERVFGLFERLDSSVEGTGVGLALVKRIVEVHGGRIWIESEGPGRGSTFYFTLPQKRA